jgi:hypothetical protein
MKKNIIAITILLLFLGCSANRNTTFLTVDHQRIQTIGFENSGNLYVIKYKNEPNLEILQGLLKKYKNLQPKHLKHVNSVSIVIKKDKLKETIKDFLQAGQIEYIERTPAKKTF